MILRSLNNIFIHVFYFSLPSLECYKTPRELPQRYPMPGRRAMPAEGNGTSFIPALWHEKALLFLRTASDRRYGAVRAAIPFFKILSRGYQCHIRERGLAAGLEGSGLQYGYRCRAFKEFRSPLFRFSSHSPPPPRPSNFPYFSPNRLARDSASCITGVRARAWLPARFCAAARDIPSCDSYLPVIPLFPRLFPKWRESSFKAAASATEVCRDQFPWFQNNFFYSN